MQRPGGGNSDVRAARGSVAPRKMACRLARGDARFSRFKAITSRTGRGSLIAAPSNWEQARGRRGLGTGAMALKRLRQVMATIGAERRRDIHILIAAIVFLVVMYILIG